MSRGELPSFIKSRILSNEEALKQIVVSGATVASGFGPSEPHTFYATIWRHIQAENITDLNIRSAFFLAPHELCVGDAMKSKGLLKGLKGGSSVFNALGKKINEATRKLEGLGKLIDHYEEMKERRIKLISPFISPVTNMIIPGNALTRALYPDYVNRNSTRIGVTDMQSIHFCDAMEGLAFTPEGEPRIDSFVMVLTPPNDEGYMSNGISNGANQEIIERITKTCDVKVLLYINKNYPFTYGYNEAANTIHIDAFKKLSKEGKLFVVMDDDGKIPSLPPNSLSNPLPEEIQIGEHIANHIELNKKITYGRAIQVGLGGTGILAIKALKESSWKGRSYSEMIEQFTLDLFEAGKISGSHFIEKDGRRTQLDGKLVCTFALCEENSNFYQRLHENKAVVMGPASRVVISEGFYGGLGINNCLGIDFNGHVNSSGRGKNWYSGIGGAASIMRGLAKGGIGYLCMKSTHKTLDGKLRSSIFPYLPQGTPVSVIGPDIMGGREGARFFLVTERGVAQLSGCSQSQLIKNLISVADPRFQDWLKKQAYEEYRIVV